MGGISVRQADGVDVTVINPVKFVYINGSETQDGSIRFTLEDGETITNIEARASGVWNDTSIRVGSASVRIGRDMTLSAVAGHLETFNPSLVQGHARGLIPQIQFDDAGTQQLLTPIVKAEEIFVVYSGAVSETIATTIGINFSTTPARLVENSIHRTGTVAATQPITVSFYVGTDNTGTLFNRFRIPASLMPASSVFQINYDNTLGFESGTSIFQEFVSTTNISLATDSGGNPLTSHEGHTLSQISVLSENLMYDETVDHMLDENLNPMFAIQFP